MSRWRNLNSAHEEGIWELPKIWARLLRGTQTKDHAVVSSGHVGPPRVWQPQHKVQLRTLGKFLRNFL